MNWTEYKIIRQWDGRVWRDWTPIPIEGLASVISKAVQRWGHRIEIKMRGQKPPSPPSVIDFMKETS